MKNWSYKITEGEHAGETLWSGRYCCVAGFVLKHRNGSDIKILATQRGKACPDFQGLWCCPCGFLEADETGEEGIVREIKEETTYRFDPNQFNLFKVETDPKLSNKGHVTLMYVAVVSELFGDWEVFLNDEVSDIRWIPVDEIGKYDWAFGHDKIINELMETL